MEGRRIEGVFLDTAVLRNKAYEAYETAKVFQIRILSTVSEALLSSFGEVGTRFRATVKAAEQGKVLLLLENGYEVEAENKLSMPVKVGQELSLVLEAKEPIMLRVERAFSGIRGAQELLKVALETGAPLLKGDNLKELMENSGLVYERRVWDALRGVLSTEDIRSDMKYQALQSLSRANTSSIESLLKNLKLPEQFSDNVKSLLELAQRGEKISFFRELVRFESELSSYVNNTRQRLENLRDLVRNVVRTFVESFIKQGNTLGIKAELNQEKFTLMESNPKAIDIFREALKSLEEGKVAEFSKRLELLGIKMNNQQNLLPVRDKILTIMRELVKGANTALSSQANTEDVQELARLMRNLSEEINRLGEAHRAIRELPSEIKESLSKLENISYMQAYFVAQEGRKFVVPFNTEEGKGLLAFSLKDVFRIFVRLSFEEGYLGIVMEAPKKQSPEYISILFKTNIDPLIREINRSMHTLKGDLQELGLKVKKMEVLEESLENFDKELASELGEESVFNLRV